MFLDFLKSFQMDFITDFSFLKTFITLMNFHFIYLIFGILFGDFDVFLQIWNYSKLDFYFRTSILFGKLFLFKVFVAQYLVIIYITFPQFGGWMTIECQEMPVKFFKIWLIVFEIVFVDIQLAISFHFLLFTTGIDSQQKKKRNASFLDWLF